MKILKNFVENRGINILGIYKYSKLYALKGTYYEKDRKNPYVDFISNDYVLDKHSGLRKWIIRHYFSSLNTHM